MVIKKTNSPKKHLILMLLSLLFVMTGTQNVTAFYQDDQQEPVLFKQYKGEILDAKSKKPLIFATLSITESNISTITNTEKIME